ncbi:MAG: CocE/NonD family hydrolase [Janthinobacterium lividum]
MRKAWISGVLAASAMVLGPPAFGQQAKPNIPDPAGVQDEAPPPDYKGPLYTRSEAMIPVRDGVRLHAVIFRPQGSATSTSPLPFLMQRTPYGVTGMTARAIESGKPELAASGYIFVYADIRGRYGSEGRFVMNRTMVAHKHKTDVDESTDARDTVDWLLKNVPNNDGKVGVLGISYPGFLAMMAGVDAHPAVKAISPQAPMTDVWLGDDFFHNGAFRESYGFDYVQQLEAQKTSVIPDAKQDQYTFFLDHVNFAGAAASAGMTGLPTAQRFLNEPTYTKFWQDMAVQRRLGKPEVPTLEVGGYWDQEDMWGPQAEYAALHPHESENDPQHKVFLVLGPWNHGGWARGAGTELVSQWGGMHFGDQNTVMYYRTVIEAPFFELYLKGKPGFDLQDTASFRTGENAWHRYAAWPPKVGYHTIKAYLAPEKVLTSVAPQAAYDTQSAAYVADPADPIPYRHRPVQSTYGENSTWRTWLVEDQSFVSDRKDLANFETPVLTSPVTVTGEVTTDLFASTTGTDGDWVIKLIDVAPEDGYKLMVAEEIFRGRYRHSFTTPEAVKSGEVNEYKWSLHGVDHTFLPGHRMMVEVQSSWFPLYDRNPQTFVPNIMTAPASAYHPETVTLYDSPKYPSHLELPLAEGSDLP